MEERWRRFCYWGEKGYRLSAITLSGMLLTIYLRIIELPMLTLLTIPVMVGGGIALMMGYAFDSKLDSVPVLRNPELWMRRRTMSVSLLGYLIGLTLVIEVVLFLVGSVLLALAGWGAWSVLTVLQAYVIELKRRELLRPKSPEGLEWQQEQFVAEFYAWLNKLPETPGPDNDPR